MNDEDDRTGDLGSRGKLRGLWAALQRDAEFRGTFVGAVVLPALCLLVVLGWIVRSLVRGG
jgi:hypothetical protein